VAELSEHAAHLASSAGRHDLARDALWCALEVYRQAPNMEGRVQLVQDRLAALEQLGEAPVVLDIDATDPLCWQGRLQDKLVVELQIGGTSDPTRSRLESLRVVPELRRRGVATQILRWVAAEQFAQGTRVLLASGRSEFLLHLGFCPSAQGMVLFLDEHRP
jgi:GNAT superfamily N-acetyltransferase